MKADYTLVIDPGLHGCGATFGISNTVVRAAYVKGNLNTKETQARLWEDMANSVKSWEHENIFVMHKWRSTRPVSTFLGGELVIELPQIYKASHQRGGKECTDPDDIIHLAGCVGAIIGTLHYPRTVIYRPFQWKGQVPKEICHARAIKALTPEELAVVNAGCTPKSLAHNVLDSVAMYLKHVGRVV